jgi:hypothetical protein
MNKIWIPFFAMVLLVGCATHSASQAAPVTEEDFQGQRPGRAADAAKVAKFIERHWNDREGREAEVMVVGQVARPGRQQLHDWNAAEAITLAGGFTRLADSRSIYVYRGETLTFHRYSRENAVRALEAIQLQQGDVVIADYLCTSFGASAFRELEKPQPGAVGNEGHRGAE